jgi:hypothetical protein
MTISLVTIQKLRLSDGITLLQAATNFMLLDARVPCALDS